MRKILMVLHGEMFPESAFSFIKHLNEVSPVHLTGLVIPEIPRIENWAAYSAATAGNLQDTATQTNTSLFVQKCKDHHIAYSVHRGSTGLGLPQIVKETRFADVLIASYTGFYAEEGDSVQQTLRQVMHQSECPVIVIPEGAGLPEQLLFAYDGSESSMFALKQFTYLFPELCKLDTVLVYMDKDGTDIPYKQYIEEWVKGYFHKSTFVTVNYNAAQYFSNEINAKQALVVTGSFGRTELSQWVHPSFAEELLSKYKLLLFSCNRN